jgi:succinate dehydrogenase / fumarate reductase, cytochrome b subunit
MSTAATPRAKTPAPSRPRPRLLHFWDSSIGKKVIVAVTGFVLVAYVVLHMVGNLAALSGPSNADESASIDRYAHFLRTFGTPLFPYSFVLWVIRVALFAALVIHVVGIVQLYRRNSAASPQANRRIGRSWASRTMYFTGPLVLAFLILHILMFTSLTIDIGGTYREGEVYNNLYLAFNAWWVVLIYVVAVLSVGYHLRHGIWSAVQTLGFDSPRRNAAVRLYSTGVAFLVTVGFLLPPILFWSGALPSPVR